MLLKYLLFSPGSGSDTRLLQPSIEKKTELKEGLGFVSPSSHKPQYLSVGLPIELETGKKTKEYFLKSHNKSDWFKGSNREKGRKNEKLLYTCSPRADSPWRGSPGAWMSPPRVDASTQCWACRWPPCPLRSKQSPRSSQNIFL